MAAGDPARQAVADGQDTLERAAAWASPGLSSGLVPPLVDGGSSAPRGSAAPASAATAAAPLAPVAPTLGQAPSASATLAPVAPRPVVSRDSAPSGAAPFPQGAQVAPLAAGVARPSSEAVTTGPTAPASEGAPLLSPVVSPAPVAFEPPQRPGTWLATHLPVRSDLGALRFGGAPGAVGGTFDARRDTSSQRRARPLLPQLPGAPPGLSLGTAIHGASLSGGAFGMVLAILVFLTPVLTRWLRVGTERYPCLLRAGRLERPG